MRLMSGLSLLAILVLGAGAAFADVHAIQMKGGTSRVTVTEDGRDAVALRVDVAELQAVDVQTKAGAFTRLLIPGFHASTREGAPELPMMNRLIAVPPIAASSTWRRTAWPIA
jgi:hypothetical protein